VSETIVSTINSGQIHIVEPDLDMLVQGAVASGKLKAHTKPVSADVFIIAVPTPLGEDKAPELKYVVSAAKSIAAVLRKGSLVILESTVPVSTTELLRDQLASARPNLTFPFDGADDDADVAIAHCPERVLPGVVLRELINNDRVIGGITPRCAHIAAAFYRKFVQGECLLTTARTAELSKLSENAFRDVGVAFANELALVCDELSVDVWELISLANRHPRVNILNPGPGVGGHCIAVDPWFIVHSAPRTAKVIAKAREVNDGMPMFIQQKVLNLLSEKKLSSVACLGLAYKADIDDLRESPAVEVVRGLCQVDGLRILVVEPNIDELPPELTKMGVELMPLKQAIEKADVVCCLVDHKEFKEMDASLLKQKLIIDTRGVWQ